MFKNPFSFEGRIRRTEYGLSFIITVVARIILLIIIGSTITSQSDVQGAQMIYYILSLPIFWFFFAQGAKRCHDAGFSGWWQLVPLCPLVLLFVSGEEVANKYGDNPKLKFVKAEY